MRTAHSLQRQIDILERKLSTINQPVKEYFSLKGKIDKLKKELQQTKQFEFLAR